MKKKTLKCKSCGESFEYGEADVMMSYDKGGKYYVVCPNCKQLIFINKSENHETN